MNPTLSQGARRLRVCLVNPRFRPSYWGLEHALPLLPGDKRNTTVTGALPALAALAPEFCDVTLLDENVEEIDFTALATFDVVGVTGMIVQRERMREILARLRGLGPIVVAGGPYVSVAEEEFVQRCDVRFVGEAEETWPEFLRDLAHGRPTFARYQQFERTDMATVPAPRYDLLKVDRYVIASLQFSRGCPFLCEFCDIITIFGRRPRTKTTEQMLREFDTLRRAGMRQCFLVDDNFIGNKAKARELLLALIPWQEQHGYPLLLSTEASINLADEPELLDLMHRANFRQVFIGIESPRATSLAETRKNQNLRGDSMAAKLQRIRDSGLVIQAGFIVGFDADDAGIFEEQYDFIQDSGIAMAIVAPLSAIPGTPLHDRLKKEGRLLAGNPRLNIRPLQMEPDVLLAGYDRLMHRLYDPDAYFGRLLQGYARSEGFRARRARLQQVLGAPGTLQRWAAGIGGLGMALRLLGTIVRAGLAARLLPAYWRQWRSNRALPGGIGLSFPVFVRLCVDHWHFFNVAMASRVEFGQVASEPVPAVQA